MVASSVVTDSFSSPAIFASIFNSSDRFFILSTTFCTTFSGDGMNKYTSGSGRIGSFNSASCCGDNKLIGISCVIETELEPFYHMKIKQKNRKKGRVGCLLVLLLKCSKSAAPSHSSIILTSLLMRIALISMIFPSWIALYQN